MNGEQYTVRQRMRKFITPVTIALSLLAAIALAVWVIAPTLRAVVSLHAATVAEHEQLERRYRRTIEHGQVARELQEITAELATLRSRVPKERDALRVVRDLEDIATRHRLEERIAIDWSATRSDGRRFRRVPTTIELSGAYPDLVAALRDFERLPLPPVADHFAITTGSLAGLTAESTRRRVQLVIRGETLWEVNE